VAQVAPAAPAAAANSSVAGAKLVVPSFAGQGVDGIQAGVIPCYKAKTGGDVEIMVAGSSTELVQKVMATRDKPALDVLIGTDLDMMNMADLGIVEKLDPAKMPNLANILPFFKDPYDGYSFAFDGGGFGLAYNAERVKNPPSSWVEFTERVIKGEFGKAVMFPHITSGTAQPVGWLLNRELGGSVTDPTPYVKRIKEMRPKLLKLYISPNDPDTSLTRGEVDMSIISDGRAFFMQDQGAKNIQYKVLAPASPALSVGFVKVKNSSPAAWEYLNCAADAKNQVAWNKFFPGYYMSHKDIDYPPGSRERQDPSSLDRSFKNFVFPPWRELAKAWPQWVEMWTKEVGG
jgi:putative spermidine/putrescine transport system substrate-binding protein